MKRRLLHCLIVAIILLIATGTICAQSATAKKAVITAVKIDKPIELTGKLDNPVWQTATPIELNYEVMPGENIKAPQRTIVRTVYDEKNLYFGFQCFDTNPGQIRANISDRDKIFDDDFVGVMIDPYGDFYRAYELMVNPYGIKADLMRTGNNEDESFDMIWETAASRNENGWTAVMMIPFSSLNFPNKEEQVWTLTVMRIIPRESKSQISWTPYDRNIPNIMVQGGELRGLRNIKSGGSIEFLPYLMGQKSGFLSDNNNPNSGIKYNPIIGRFGGGIKYAPSASFQLDAVINPDFSQIESDADQISVNTTFALQYDEKRPFFLNGRELFNTPVYYSRSINDPLWAGRIMGKSGGLTYYLMSAYDRNTVYIVPGEEMSSTIPTNMKSIVNVGRVRYELGNERYIGGIILTRNMKGGHNYDFGLDWGYRFFENWNFKGEIHLSQTKELNDTTMFNSQRIFGNTEYNAAFNGEDYSGMGMDVQLNHSGRNYSFYVEYQNITPTFQTYNGIVTSNGYRMIAMEHDYTLYPENSFFNRFTFFVNSNLKFNFVGAKKEQTVVPGISFETKGQTNFNISYLLVNDENFFNTDLTGVNRVQFNINSRPLKEISIYLNGRFGNFIYRSSNPLVGSGHDLSATIQLRPTSQLDISFSYTRANLKNKETNELFYDGNIYRAVGIYQFTPEVLFRTILQYNTFDKSFQLYPLFSYKLNAFTTFFAGVTSNYMNYEGEYGFKNTDQQYFIKIQYLLGI
jgi:hypothetical protein